MAISTTAFPFTSEVTYDAQGWPELDRAVDSTVLRNMIKKFFSNGLFLSADANCWAVTAPSDDSLTVTVSPGAGVIQGATGYTENSGTLTLPAADASLPRYDMIVARLNDNNAYRNIYLDVVTGTAASTPAYPDLTQSDSVWEIGIAAVLRPAASTTITQSNITDLRANSDYAGQVNAIDSIDTSEWSAQLDAYYLEYVARSAAYESASQASFTAWFEDMKDQLSEDAAGNLQLEIDDEELKRKGFEGVTTVFNADGSISSTDEESRVATTVFNADGSIVTTLKDANDLTIATSTTVFNADGSITTTATRS